MSEAQCIPLLVEGLQFLLGDEHPPIYTAGVRKGYAFGSIHRYLWEQGQIPNPYQRTNTTFAEGYSARHIRIELSLQYRKTDPDDRVQLCCEGLRPRGDILLDGISLAQNHWGMFAPFTCELDDAVLDGRTHRVIILIRPPAYEEPQHGSTSKIEGPVSRLDMGWDFAPRLPYRGIETVYLRKTGPVRLEHLAVDPVLTADLNSATFTFGLVLSAAHARQIRIVLTVHEQDAGEQVLTSEATYEVEPGETTLSINTDPFRPKLWWPNGFGAQPLYQAEVRVIDSRTGRLSDQSACTIGIRELSFPQDDSGAVTIPRLCVNGVLVFLKGGSLVPTNLLYEREEEMLKHQLECLRAANVNCIRLSGSGPMPGQREPLLRFCQELGLVLWDEAPLTGSATDSIPSTEEGFITKMEGTTAAMVEQGRNNAAIVLFCGGNELSDAAREPIAEDSSPVLARMKEVANTHAPRLYWTPTSPHGATDVHGPWRYGGTRAHYEHYNTERDKRTLISEAGVPGFSCFESILRRFGEKELQPFEPSNPRLVDVNDFRWWIDQKNLERWFGELPELTSFIEASQCIQWDGVRYLCECMRHREHEKTGILIWNLNEPYPNLCNTNVIDFWGEPKPAYYGMKHAFEPVHLAAELATVAWSGETFFRATLFGSNSNPSPIDGRLTWRIVCASGRVYQKASADVLLPPSSGMQLETIRFPLDELSEEVFFLDLVLKNREGKPLSQNRYAQSGTETLQPWRAVPKTTLDIYGALDQDGSTLLTVTNSGRSTAMFVWLEGARPTTDPDPFNRKPPAVRFEDNYLSLLPGERREVRAWSSTRERQNINIKGWNTETVTISF